MDDLRITPLYEMHLSLGGKMVPFAGYSLPVQYSGGVMKEHIHTRSYTGLFDVSHMGQVLLAGKSWDDTALAFERLVPQSVLDLKDGQQRYGFFTNSIGGIEDDIMFSRRGQHLFLVVNASRKANDIRMMRNDLEPQISVQHVEDRALFALQGPLAERVLEALVPGVSGLKFMETQNVVLSGHELWLSRSGYTGADGFEISLPETYAETFFALLLAQEGVEAIGLGARDSLRLEAGLCLFGQDLNPDTTPIEAGLSWAIQKARRAQGDRAGGFPGAEIIHHHLSNGTLRKRVGLRPEGRAPMREGVELFGDENAERRIGKITSGGFGPSLGAPIAMGYVEAGYTQPDQKIYANVRNKILPVQVAKLPFVPHQFKK